MNLAVRPFIPNLLRCFQCQRFGHSKTNYRGTLTCDRCAEKGHDSQQCTTPEKCVNCSSDHTSFSRLCPRWKLEKDIITIKTKEQISYPEAKRKIMAQTPTPGVSYSTAVKQSYCENCSCKNCAKFAIQINPVKPSDSDTDPSANSAPEVNELPKRKKPNQNLNVHLKNKFLKS
ncbi:hypothetical protein HNY73_009969 [Argiope bruennichi]|uniref:CCHC-type domain-containing protein n=1 Tax=Argiope bruennichi TaxID=94029 RepID=A0A8T0F1P7_ARGBR|nr:hypothetical protein HNY73_009969 [Argiope bruennichi]